MMEYGIFDERLGRSSEKIWLLPLEEKEKRIKEIYKKKKGRELNLANPQTYSEKIQWYKLYYHNPNMTRCVDKVEIKKYIAERIGKGYTAKLLKVWNTPDEVSFDELPDTFTVKSNCQGDGRYINIVHDKKSSNLEALKEEIKKYWFNPLNLLTNGFCNAYRDVVPRVFAEEYIRNFSGEAAREYKILCFDGKPEVCYMSSIHVEKNDEMSSSKIEYSSFYTLDSWERIDVLYGTYPGVFPPHYNAPKSSHHEEMLAIAKALSEGFPYVRVDFIDTTEKLYVGELTFYHGGGYVFFEPEEYDKKLGSYFRLPEKTEMRK